MGRARCRVADQDRPRADVLNGYQPCFADLAAAGLASGDVAYTVREGPVAGRISAGIEPPPADGSEMIMLIAGPMPGEYHLDAIRLADGVLIATQRFRVAGTWPDPDNGPPVVVADEHQPYSLINWGGTGALATNYIRKAPPVWRVMVVLVSTKDRRWNGLDAAASSEWQDRLLGNDSVRRYYEEVSAFKPGVYGMTVTLVSGGVLGPIDLPYSWAELYEKRVPPSPEIDPGWLTNKDGANAMAAATSDFLARRADGKKLLAETDSVAFIVRSGSDGPKPIAPGVDPIPTMFNWGHAKSADFWIFEGLGTKPVPKPAALLADTSPPSVTDNPTHVLIHEIGHNLGMADLYDRGKEFGAEIDARHPFGLDLMATTSNVPWLSLGHLVGLGWIQDNWVRNFDFRKVELGDSLVLQSVESVNGKLPPFGNVAGVEIKIDDGWSYLFEYRRRRPGQVGDQRLEDAAGAGHDKLIVGMDMRLAGIPAPPGQTQPPRPPIIALGTDAEGDGPMLVTNGQNYLDNDTTNPDRMFDFSLTLDDLEDPLPESARVTVSYVGARRVQLWIAPGGSRGNFKSADIRIANPNTDREFVVKGATNKIKITVHNAGVIPATNVRIHVAWLPYTVSAGPWVPLPDPLPFVVPAKGQTEVTVDWPVPLLVPVGNEQAHHFCVGVRIDGFTSALHPENTEVVLSDNWAQSNFADESVDFGSPSTRKRTVVTVSNPLPTAHVYEVEANQDTAWYRVYVGNSLVAVGPRRDPRSRGRLRKSRR